MQSWVLSEAVAAGFDDDDEDDDSDGFDDEVEEPISAAVMPSKQPL